MLDEKQFSLSDLRRWAAKRLISGKQLRAILAEEGVSLDAVAPAEAAIERGS